MTITKEYSNSINTTQRTIAEQNGVNTEYVAKFNELRRRYPREDIMAVMEAASNAVAEMQTIEQQLADAIERTAKTIAYSDAVLDEMYAECRERDDIGRDTAPSPWFY